MIIEISIAGVAAATGALAPVVVAYIKNRGKSTNGNGNGHKPCLEHAVMKDQLERGEKRFDKIDKKLDRHGETLTTISTSLSFIEGKLSKE